MKKAELLKRIIKLEDEVNYLNRDLKEAQAILWGIENPQKYFPGDIVEIMVTNSAGEEESRGKATIKEYKPPTGNYPFGRYIIERDGKIDEAWFGSLKIAFSYVIPK